MRRDLMERRLKLLDYHFSGGLTQESAQNLAAEFGVSPDTIWSDYSRRADWIPDLFVLRDGDAKVNELAALLEKALRSAYRQMVMSSGSVKVGALRTVSMIAGQLASLYADTGITKSVWTEFLEKLAKLEEDFDLGA